METKSFTSKVVEIEGEDGRTVTGLSAIIGVVDAGNDLIFKGAFTKTIQDRAARVKHLWQHDMTKPPIASIVHLEEVGAKGLPKELREAYPDATGGLLVKRRYLETPRANEVLAGLKADPPAITEMSFGYDAVKFDFKEIEEGVLIRNLREIRLWDTSDVNWGMNEATVAQLKTALPYKDTGKAPADESWSAPKLSDFTSSDFGELSDSEKKRIASHYTWSENSPPETFGDLKLPHHKASNDGTGPAVWRGVAAAMGVLMGARGGADIPSADLSACHAHLSKHYEQFEKEPPSLKVLLAVRALNDLVEERKDDALVFQRIQELNELLRAEPQDALTLREQQKKLLQRIAVMKKHVVLLKEFQR